MQYPALKSFVGINVLNVNLMNVEMAFTDSGNLAQQEAGQRILLSNNLVYGNVLYWTRAKSDKQQSCVKISP
jgi:hypothetical protein